MSKRRNTLILITFAVLAALFAAGMFAAAVIRTKTSFPAGKYEIALEQDAPFECILSFEAVKHSGKKVFCINSASGENIISITPLTTVENSRKQTQIIIKNKSKIICANTRPVNQDNRTGKCKIKVTGNSSELAVWYREFCDIYCGVFQKEVEIKQNIPAILPVYSAVKYNIYSGNSTEKLLDALNKAVMIIGFVLLTYTCGIILYFLKLPVPSAGPDAANILKSLLSTVLIVFSAYIFIDINPVTPDISDTVLNPAFLNPEPQEQLLYLITLAASLLSIWYFYNYSPPEHHKIWLYCLTPCAVIFALFFLIKLPTNQNNCFAAIFAAVFSCIACYMNRKRKIILYINIVPVIIAVIYAIMMINCYFSRNFDYFDAHHYSVVMHPVWLAFNGFAPMNSYCTYGSYAFFALPFFKLAGLDSTTVDLFWCILIFSVWLLVFSAVYNVTKSRIWALWSAVCVAGLSFVTGSPQHYAQYLPLRMIFPAILLFIVSKMKNPCDLKYIFSGTVLSVAAIFWNPDSGCILFTAWSIFLCAAVWISRNHKTAKIYAITLYIVSIALSFVSIWLTYFAIYKVAPNLKMLWVMPLFFGKTGNLQLPIEFPGIWLLPGVIYFIFLYFSVKNILHKKSSVSSGFILFTTLLGCGIFSYYIGRSHQSNLLLVVYPCAILLCVGVAKIKQNKLLRCITLFVVVFVSSAGLFNISPDSGKQEKTFFSNYFNRLTTDIEKNLDDDKYLIYTGPLEALLAVELQAKPAFEHHAIEELIFKKDCREYVEKIRRCKNNALWVINCDYLTRHTDTALQKPVKELIRERLGMDSVPNAMLMFKLR